MHRTLACWIALGSTSCFDEATSQTGEGPGSTADTTDASMDPPTTSATVGTMSTSDGPTTEPSDTGTVDTSDTGTTVDPTDAPPRCSDGIVDEGEECDDSDTEDADGCNADCRVSGQFQWGHVHGDVDEDIGHGIVVVPNGDVFATGRMFVAGIHDDVWLASWTSTGAERFSHEIDLGAATNEFGHDITASPDGLVLSISTEDGAALLRADPMDGARMEPVPIESEDGSAFLPFAVAAGASSYYFVGASQTQPQLPAIVRVNQFFAPLWAVDDVFLADSSSYTGVAVGNDEDTVSCGSAGNDGFMHRRDAATGDIVWTTDGLPRVRGIAIANDGDIVLVGTAFVAATQEDLWVSRFGPDGAQQQWQHNLDGGSAADDRGIAVAIDALGHITVAGTASGGDALLAKLDPDGTTRWRITGGSAELGMSLDLTDMAVSPDGDISVVGAAFGEAGDGEIFVAHFSR